MQFGSNVVDEIIVPNNVPFLPGNNVIGIGTEVPPELVTAGFTSALIFYNAQYSPTSTEARVVYQFIATGGDPDPAYQVGVSIGYTWQANPSTNSAYQVVQVLTAGAVAPSASGYSYLYSVLSVGNHLNNTIFEVTEFDSAGDGEIGVINNAGTHTAVKTVGSSTPSTTWTVT